MTGFRRCLALAGCVTLASTAPLQAQGAGTAAPPNTILARRYREGETLRYHMSASHQSRQGIVRYEADATGRVQRDSLGRFVEAFEWSNLHLNGTAVPLPGGAPVRQRLTLQRDYVLPPDIAHADPRLIGPLLDLYTFYVDLRLATRSLVSGRPWDSVRVPGRGANSWADGRQVLVGDDAIDFVITLESVDRAAGVARVLVRHVPPETGRVTLPADWMQPRLGAEPNNWVQIAAAPGGYTAGVGRESFDVRLTVRLADGRLLSATMDNPVEVLERTCADRELTKCGEAVRSEIRRRISLDLVPGT